MNRNAFSIAGRSIGANEPVYLVAELSANHRQKLGVAKELVRAAAASGADAIKLQTYTADTITLKSDDPLFQISGQTLWDGKTLHQLYQEAQMPWDWYGELAQLADALGLACFSSPFDQSAVDFLEEQKVPAYKVASFELVDLPLLRKIAAMKKPIILSTGMATLEEIGEALDTIAAVNPSPIALLRTNSGYPADPSEMNLRVLGDLRDRFNVVVGLSDHSFGIAVPIAAASLGAEIIEKHLTLRRADGGADAAFSLEPEEFRQMVDGVRTAEKALGNIQYGPSAREQASLRFRRSLFVTQDVKQGDLLSTDNVRSVRPAAGLHPRHLEAVLGRKVVCDVQRATPLTWDLIEKEQ